MALAGAVGLGYRIMTAGVIGANIGGGLVLFAAVPTTAVAVLAVVLIVMSSRRAARETVTRLPGPRGAR